MKNKPEYWYRQSGVIPFRTRNDLIELLIISNRKNNKWIFPKGIVESELNCRSSAIKEAKEEAGIEGDLLVEKIGNYKYKKWGGKCKVRIYALNVKLIHSDWEENFRKRKWINIDEIESYVNDKKLLKMVFRLRLKINPNLNASL